MTSPAIQKDTRKPRFKQELVAEVIEDAGARYIDVMDPDSGNIFRFYEVEYAIACAMDGERDIAGIVKWAQEELGVTPTAGEISSVIATLGDLGYLDGAEAGAAREPKAAPVEELARGVVVGKAAAAATAPAEDVALGAAGSIGATAIAAAASTIDAPDLVLGKPGAAPVAPVSAAPVDDIPLGHAGAGSTSPATSGDSIPVVSDVSLDLSDNMKIGLGDVKEAVRASRVMSAVDVPKELLDAIEDKKAADTKPEPKKPEPVIEAKPEPKPEPKKPDVVADKKPEPKKPDVVADKKPEPKKPDAKKPEPKKPDVVADKKPDAKKPDTKKPDAKKPELDAKQPVPPTPSGTSPALVIVLVLVLLAAGGFFVWKYVLNKPAEGTDPTVGSAGSGGSAAMIVGSGGSAAVGSAGSAGSAMVAEKPKLDDITAKLVAEPAPPMDMKPLAANTIETLSDVAGKPVKKGDVIARMTGAKKLDDELKDLAKGVIRDQTAIDTATKAKTDAGANAEAAKKADDTIKDKTGELQKKTDQIAAKKAELEKLVVVAPADGTITFTPAGKVGNRTADSIATLAGAPTLSVTFPLTGGTPPAVGASVKLVHKADSAPLACTVTDAKPDSLKLTCDATAAKADDEVVYTPTP